jgi:hypothetical protein
VLRKKVIPEGKKGLEEKKNKKREREREGKKDIGKGKTYLLLCNLNI